MTGLISFSCCLLLAMFFIYNKKQLIVTNQVLVFYLALSALLHSFSCMIGRVNFTTPRPLLDKYCLFAGPLEVYTGWTEWMSILCISCNLLAQVTSHPKARKRLHCAYFSLIFALPLLWCWVPFVPLAFGTSGPWCGIRVLTEDCGDFLQGVILRWFLIQLPIPLLLAATVSLSLVTWVCMKHRLQQQETNSYLPQSSPIDKAQMLAELKVLLWYPPTYAVLRLLPLTSLVYDSISPTSPHLPLWYLPALTSPLPGAAIALLIWFNTDNKCWARLRSWLSLHLSQRSEDLGSPSCRSSVSSHTVSEYRCDLNVSYGDSLEGVRKKHRRDRIRKASQTTEE